MQVWSYAKISEMTKKAVADADCILDVGAENP